MDVVIVRKPYLSFFLIIGLIGLFGAIAGFTGTFFIPVSAGTFKVPFVIYLHGAFAFSWIILFVTQTFLIHYNKYKTHIILGYSGVIIALGTAIAMILAGIFATGRDLAKGLGEISYTQTTGTCTSAALFLILVILAVIYRKKPNSHKRFMLLATIVVLWPAWFRFRHYFPAISRPDIWFGVVLSDSLIILAWFFDKRIYGKIHPVLLYGGIAIIIENVIEIILFESMLWREMGKAIYYFAA